MYSTAEGVAVVDEEVAACGTGDGCGWVWVSVGRRGAGTGQLASKGGDAPCKSSAVLGEDCAVGFTHNRLQRQLLESELRAHVQRGGGLVVAEQLVHRRLAAHAESLSVEHLLDAHAVRVRSVSTLPSLDHTARRTTTSAALQPALTNTATCIAEARLAA